MSKAPVPTAQEVNEAHERAKSFAENAIGWAVKCGQLLAKKKAQLGHGQFGEWVETYCDFSDRQARRYMECASKSDTRVRFDSMRQALGYDKPAPVKRVETAAIASTEPRATKPESAPETSTAPEVPPAPPATTSPVDSGQPAPVSPAPTVAAEPEWTAEDEAELHAQEEADARQRIEAAMAADDKLAEAFRQIQQQAHEITVLKQSRDHYQRQAGEAVRLLKAEQRKVAALERKARKAA